MVNWYRFKKFLVYVQNWLSIQFVTLGFTRKSRSKLIRLGTVYGGWYIPENFLESMSNKTLLSLGVGFDVSFDKELVKSGFNVVLVDPLQACISFAKNELSSFPNCYFENVAISDHIGTEIFYPPKNSEHDAWSSINMQSTSPTSAKSFEVETLDSLLSKYQTLVSNDFLYLKMDIEGAEVKVIPQICKNQQKIGFIGIELDFLSLIPFLKFKKRINSIFMARKFLKELDSAGYKLVYTDNFNFFWDGSGNA